MIDWKQKMSLPLATSAVLSPHSLKCKFVLVVEDIQDPIKTSNSASGTAGSRGPVKHLFYFSFCKWRVGSCKTPLINACGSGWKTAPALGIISRTLNKCDHFYGYMPESAVFSLPRSFLCPALFYFCSEYRNLFPSSHLCNFKVRKKNLKRSKRLSEYSICVFQNISLVTAKMLARPQREAIGSSWLWTCSISILPHLWISWSAFAVTASGQAFYKSNLSGKTPPLM